jgi:hypothetical protein
MDFILKIAVSSPAGTVPPSKITTTPEGSIVKWTPVLTLGAGDTFTVPVATSSLPPAIKLGVIVNDTTAGLCARPGGANKKIITSRRTPNLNPIRLASSGV